MRNPTWRGVAGGGLVGSMLVSQAAVLEVIWLASGGFHVDGLEFLRLLAAYGLAGMTVAIAFATAAAGTLRIAQRTRWLEAQRLLVVCFMAVVPVGAAVAVFANKALLPPVGSLMGLAGNLCLAAAMIATAVALSRIRQLRRLGTSLAFLMVVADALLLAGLAITGGRSDQDPSTGVEIDGPLVVIAVIDTLRADHLGLYGYEKKTSPAVDAWSAEAVVFDLAFSPGNWTRPATASLLTSTLPTRHGVTDFHLALPASLETLTETFQRGGFATAVFSANPNVGAEDGYERGTDFFVEFSHRGIVGRSFLLHRFLAKDAPWAATALLSIVGEDGSSSYSPAALTDSAMSWLERRRGATFAYLHYAGPHDPYLPPQELLTALGAGELDQKVARPPGGSAGRHALSEPARRRMIAQYDAEILWHDRELGRLIDFLKRRSSQQEVVFALTSDHGEGFGENDVWSHGSSMFDEVIRVPLAIWCSRPCGEPRRVSTPVSLVDVAPTILEIVGAEAPASYEGSSLIPLMSGQAPGERRPVVSVNLKNGEGSIRTAVWSLAFDAEGGEWLWPTGLREAPRDSVRESRALRGELRAVFEQVVARSGAAAAAAPAIEVDDRRLEELRALGYLD